MSLHGTLETFALPDVMALLAATRKTGELRVVGGRIDGRVHLDEGRVVAADVGRADSFVDAVFELLRLTSGKFSFDAEKRPADSADPVDIEPLLLEAGARLTEWRGIESVVPSMDHGVALVRDLGDPHVTLAADQWRMVVAVAGARCVHEVAERLGLGEYAVCKSLKDLVESGVAEVTDPPAPVKPAPAAAPAPKAEAKPGPVIDPEPAPVVEAEAEPVAEPVAEAEAEPVAEADEPAGSEPEHEPEPAKAKHEPKHEPKPAPKVAIEPERKPDDSVGKVPVPALTTKDQTSPIPPGEEPQAKPKKAAPPAPAVSTGSISKAAEPKVDPAQAKALVSQLAAMNSDKPAAPAAPAPKAQAKADKQADDAADEAKEAEATAPASEGGDTEEPLNRGLLLKFLSSVRQ